MDGSASIITASYTRREIEEDAAVITSNDSEIIRVALRVYGSVYLACMLVYVLLRKRYPKLFNIRSWARKNRSRLACRQEYGWFSWFWRVFRVTDLELQDECGLDAVCFLRALRFGRQLTFLGCFNALWLIPLYRTAPESSDTAYLEDKFVLISISNLPTSSPRFLATVIAAYLTYFYAMYLIFHETKWFTMQRHRFLAKKKPRNYAVYVSGIPEAYRSSHQLENYFRQCSSQQAVLEAHICRETPKLDSKVARRQKVVQQLEHAVAEEKRTGKTAQHVAIHWRHYVGGCSGIRKKKSPRHNRVLQRVESVRELEAELDYLNRTIARKSQEITQAGSRRGMLCRMDASSDLLHAIQEDVLSDDPDESNDNQNNDQNDSSSIVMSPQSEEHVDEEEEAFSRHHRSGSNLSPSVGLRNETMEEEEEKKEDVLLGELLEGPPVSASAELMDHFDPAFGTVVPVLEELPPNSDAELLDHLDPALETVPVLGDEEELLHNDNELPSSGFLETIDSVNNREGSNHQSTDEEQGLTNEFLQKFEAAPAGSSALKRTGSEKRDRSECGGDKDGSERSFSSRGSSSALLVTKTIRRSVVSGSRTIGKAGTSIVEGSRATASTIAKNSRAAGAQAGKSIAKGSRVAGAQAERLIHNAGDKGKESLKKAQQVGTTLVTSAGAVVPMLLLNKSEGQAREAGFVVFTNLYMVQTALQMIHHPKPYVMDVTPAGDPCDIFWRNVGLPQRARRTGMLAALTASTILCFFWSIPMAFVSSLTEVNSLKESLPTVGRWIEKNPWLEIFFSQIAPMLLLFFNEAILPVVLKYFATWEGHISSAMLEASLFTKLGFFMIIQTFFVSALSGSLTAELTNILENPDSILTLLANSLPAQSSYFIQIALAQTFFLQAIERLRIYPLGLALLRRFIGPRLTAKERRRSFGWIASLDEPPDFWHAETFAQLILFYMVFFVYSTIAPVTSFFLCFCFILTESGYRYEFIHNYPRNFETGGVLWKDFIKFVLGSMIIAQLTLIGLLALKESHRYASALIPLLVITILFIIFITSKHSTVSNFLPTRDCILLDSESQAEGEMNMDFVKGAFLQPSLQNKTVVPDYDEGQDDYLS